MTRILDPQLRVTQVDGKPGQRRLIVTYLLDVADDEELIGTRIDEAAVVAPRDEGDAPIHPLPVEFHLEGETIIERSGLHARRLEREVHRYELDVEQDWWDTDQAGGTKPIAEFMDHLAATITLRQAGRVLTTAETPTVTGSWGALGSG